MSPSPSLWTPGNCKCICLPLLPSWLISSIVASEHCARREFIPWRPFPTMSQRVIPWRPFPTISQSIATHVTDGSASSSPSLSGPNFIPMNLDNASKKEEENNHNHYHYRLWLRLRRFDCSTLCYQYKSLLSTSSIYLPLSIFGFFLWWKSPPCSSIGLPT